MSEVLKGRAFRDIPEEIRSKPTEWWLYKILYDLFFLCKVVLHHGKKKEYRDLNEVHMKLCDFLDYKKVPILQKLILMARDMLKSSIARALIIQWFLRLLFKGERDTGFIYSGVEALAEDHAEKIWQEIVRNKILQGFFYKIIPHKKKDFDSCSAEKIRYRGIEIDIGSPKSTLTGHHYGIGINDNLSNEVNTRLRTGRQRTIRSWQEQEATLAEEALEYIFETTWWPDDVAGYILGGENFDFDFSNIKNKVAHKFVSDTGYAVFSCPAEAHGKPTFPQKLDHKYLARKKRKMGPYLYSALYLLQPVASENVVFQPSWIIHYKDLPNPFVRNMSVDLSGTVGPESTPTGITLGDWDAEGTLHLPYAQKRKLPPMEVIEWIKQLIEMSEDEGREITYIVVEKEKYGIFMADYVEKESEIDKPIIQVDLRSMPRPVRLESLVPHYNAGKIKSKPGLTEYEEEVKTFYRDKQYGTDLLDTIWGHFQVKILPHQEVVLTPEQQNIEDFQEQIQKERFGRDRMGRSIASRF